MRRPRAAHTAERHPVARTQQVGVIVHECRAGARVQAHGFVLICARARTLRTLHSGARKHLRSKIRVPGIRARQYAIERLDDSRCVCVLCIERFVSLRKNPGGSRTSSHETVAACALVTIRRERARVRTNIDIYPFIALLVGRRLLFEQFVGRPPSVSGCEKVSGIGA